MLRFIFNSLCYLFLIFFSACNTGGDSTSHRSQTRGKDLDKINIAGVEVEKFVYPETKKISNDAFNLLVRDLGISIAKFNPGDSFEGIQAEIKKIDPKDINSVDTGGASILPFLSETLFRKLIPIKDLARLEREVKKEIIIPLLEKGANPNIEDMAGKTARESVVSFAGALGSDQASLLLEPFYYYEPSPSVRKALETIGRSLFDAGDFDAMGKKAAADLKKLAPSFSSHNLGVLVGNIGQNFSTINFGDEAKLRSKDPNNALNFYRSFGQGKKSLLKLNTLPLQDAIGVLMLLAGVGTF